MRRLSLVILSLLPFAAGAQTKLRSSSEQSLIDVNAMLASALAAGDSTSLRALLAGDLVYTDQSGAAQSRAQLLSSVAGGYRVQMSTPEVTRIHIDGNLGLLDFQSKMAVAGADSALVQWSSVYVLRAGHWQLTSLHSTGAPVQARRTVPALPVAATPPSPPPVIPPIRTPTSNTDHRMTARANGSFDPEVKPLVAYNTDPSAQLGRYSIDKKFRGDLDATSKGEMLSAGNPAKGTAGYVAVEYVTGSLKGRRGGFALQHTATMDHGTQSLSVTVVPGSGTGELTGLSGRMEIIIEGGKHSYVFDYSLPRGG